MSNKINNFEFLNTQIRYLQNLKATYPSIDSLNDEEY